MLGLSMNNIQHEQNISTAAESYVSHLFFFFLRVLFLVFWGVFCAQKFTVTV